MNIKILGTGCTKCKSLEQSVRDTINEMGIEADVSKVEDIMKIMEYGIMKTPGIVINEKVVSAGKLLSKDQIKELLIQNK